MIAALILAAGQSKRMGQPKMLLPWGDTTVLEQVITTFKASGIGDILVITGGDRERVENLVRDSARTIFNPKYATSEMLSSVQLGLAKLSLESQAALIALGDQPQVQIRSVQLVIDAYRNSGSSIVIPSFRMRRGHPWLVGKFHWDEIQQMQAPKSLRDFLNRHKGEICYVDMDDDSILKDLDTPEEYLKSRP